MGSCVTKTKKNDQSFDLNNAKALSGLFAFTTPVPKVITILLEIAVPTRHKPTMTSFVLLRSGPPFLLKVWLSPHFFNNVFHELIDVRLKVNFGYCFENFSRASLIL